ncbi:MAG: hypothetical protein HKP61_05200 [Dactylosporangium sp.]|nr:hypothetical protein [Dactylosporangium sp.]NNJ60344.1 hypothetical protein [Dactylosporangium sp.]
MITSQARQRAIATLHRLWSPGGYPDAPGGPAELGTTLSAIKALGFLGDRPRDPDAVHADIVRQLDPTTGAWIAPGTGGPSVLATAAGLLGLAGIGAEATLRQRLPVGLSWMAEHAQTREEHFMTIAVAEECRAGVPLPRSVAYFRSLQQPDGTFGRSPLLNGIAAGALLRAGEALGDPQAVADLILAAQTASGGFADDGSTPQLWTSYCCMRVLDLLGIAPDRARLAEWVLAMQLDGGGFGIPGTVSANATYQCLSILDWIASPVVDAARRGDTAAVRQHLRSGGEADLHDLEGWTPLAAAAVRGQAEVVRLLLTGDEIGGKAADPGIRVPDADALPIFWAGQAGDLDTVRAILAHRPEQLFATSSVNGHTVLLQATFFGTQRHRDLVAWLLGHLDEILGLAADDADGRRDARHRLLAACNVRGYTATGMAQLWNNEALATLLSAADDTPPDQRARYYAELLATIAEPEPADERERAVQRLTDDLVVAIGQRFDALNATARDPRGDVAVAEAALLSAVTAAIETPGFDLNRRGGPLGQTPVIAAVTGVDADERVGAARLRLTSLLLRHGADPDLPERHPMAVDAVIRAAVLNHFECLREIAKHMGPLAFAAALNERPAINGQTALDDTVHRALTASDATLQQHLDQIRWVIEHGGRTDIPDLTGVTVADRARLAGQDAVLGHRAPAVLAALGLAEAVP